MMLRISDAYKAWDGLDWILAAILALMVAMLPIFVILLVYSVHLKDEQWERHLSELAASVPTVSDCILEHLEYDVDLTKVISVKRDETYTSMNLSNFGWITFRATPEQSLIIRTAWMECAR